MTCTENVDMLQIELGSWVLQIVKDGHVILFVIAAELNDPSHMPMKMVNKERLSTVFNEQKGWQIVNMTEGKYDTVIHEAGYANIWRVVIKKV